MVRPARGDGFLRTVLVLFHTAQRRELLGGRWGAGWAGDGDPFPNVFFFFTLEQASREYS
jgi:hypothetical protein